MSPIRNIRSLAVLLVVFVHQIAMGQTETAATVPASFAGTYNLTYSLFGAGGPLEDDQAVTLVVGTDNSLCVDGKTLSSPILRNGNQHEAIWLDSATNAEYALSSLVDGFNEVNVGGPGGSPFYGQLQGSKSSDDTSCVATTTVTAAMTSVFELAESKLSEFFPAGAVTLFLENYVYRFYESTGVYLAFADGNVFLLGGGFGEAVVEAGSISSVLTILEDFEVSVGDTGEDTSGLELWNLSISGDLTVLGNAVNFAGIDLVDVPAPDLDSTDELNNEINSTLEGVATSISSISITVVTNTSTQRTFDVTFSATANGVAVSYNLRYDYTM